MTLTLALLKVGEMRSQFKGNIIVTNMPSEMTSARLAEFFDEFGIVIGAEIRPIASNSGANFIGVVALAPESVVDDAIKAANHRVVDGRKIKVGRAKPPAPKEKKAPPPRAAAPAPKPAAAPSQPAPIVMGGASVSSGSRTVIVETKPRRRIVMPGTVRPS